MTEGARGSLACEKALHMAQAARKRLPPPPTRARFRVFPRLASLASFVVCLTLAVEVTLNKLLKDSGYGSVEIVIKVGGVLD